MSFTDHTQCVAPKDYSGPFIPSGAMTATIVIAIIAAILYPGALTLDPYRRRHRLLPMVAVRPAGLLGRQPLHHRPSVGRL